jgi:hypothetical protein
MAVTGLKFLTGEALISSYEAPLLVMPPRYRRDFCRDCGSPVPSPTTDPGVHVVWAGSLDDDPGVSPCEHVWVNCERPWEQEIDDLPRLTEAQFVLDRVQKHERSGGENIRELYNFIVERYAEDDAEVVATAKFRLSELDGELNDGQERATSNAPDR